MRNAHWASIFFVLQVAHTLPEHLWVMGWHHLCSDRRGRFGSEKNFLMILVVIHAHLLVQVLLSIFFQLLEPVLYATDERNPAQLDG